VFVPRQPVQLGSGRFKAFVEITEAQFVHQCASAAPAQAQSFKSRQEYRWQQF
jgi:hypothetical protein